MKTCTGCRTEKPLSAFRVLSTTDGVTKYRAQCKSCENEYGKTWRKSNPEKETRRTLRNRASILGVDKEVVSAYWDAHSGTCDICGGEPLYLANRLDIEHDHLTNEFRGLTCGDCNNILKFAADDISRLERAIEYLKNPPARMKEK